MSTDAFPEPRRKPLSRMRRYFQYYLLALFVNDVYVFSVIYAFLPSYLLDSGYSTTDLSHAFGSDGISNSVGLLVLLYINGMPRVNAMSLRIKFCFIVAATVVCLAGSALITAVPTSYPVLVGSKALQGLASAVYFSYSYVLINKLFPLEYQAQAAAFVTAGARQSVNSQHGCSERPQRQCGHDQHQHAHQEQSSARHCGSYVV
jgi:MFS family permease